MTPEGLLAVARLLADASHEPDRTNRHSAINRAYCAVFTAARRLLEGEGFVLTAEEPTHTQIRKGFRSGDPMRTRLEMHLTNLSRLRCRADYKDELPPSARDMDNALSWADEALKIVGHIKGRR